MGLPPHKKRLPGSSVLIMPGLDPGILFRGHKKGLPGQAGQ
jgi:hypothetical protein